MQEYINKVLGSGHNRPLSSASRNNTITTVIILNNEMEDIIEIVKSLEDPGLLLKGITETVQNEVKEQKVGFLSMLTGASLLGNILPGKGINRTGKGHGINRTGEGALATRKGRGILRAGYSSRCSKMDF